ncbi:hypothetical protein [Mangrovimonas futianensis]|nr:hypothetical protein [Mangrovimonas futianensis]MCF1422369.1 hypothetical protein [Mangrovimonas futianensis]
MIQITKKHLPYIIHTLSILYPYRSHTVTQERPYFLSQKELSIYLF